MTEYAELIEPGVIRLQRLLPASAEKVWEYLTDSEKRGQWLASGEMDLRVSGLVHLNFDHSTLSEDDDPIPEKYCSMKNGASQTGRITALEPKKLLRFTWESVAEDASEVTFALEEEGAKTLLTITHRRLPEEQFVSVCSGWHAHTNILMEVLEGKSTSGFWRLHNRLESAYRQKVRC